jgi:hypothetical protein
MTPPAIPEENARLPSMEIGFSGSSLSQWTLSRNLGLAGFEADGIGIEAVPRFGTTWDGR